MARTFKLSPLAEQCLLRAQRRFYSYAGPTAPAVARVKAISTAIKDLTRMPVMWPFGLFPGIRERPAGDCRIYYSVHPDTGRNATAGDVEILYIRLPGEDEPLL